jgi:hypothetical protein
MDTSASLQMMINLGSKLDTSHRLRLIELKLLNHHRGVDSQVEAGQTHDAERVVVSIIDGRVTGQFSSAGLEMCSTNWMIS